MAQSSAEVAYEVALRRLDSQLHRVDVVESKIAVVVGLGGTAMGIFAGFAAVAVEPDERASVTFAAIAGVIVLAVYVVAVFNALRVSAIGEWDEQPNWDDLLDTADAFDLSEVQRWVAGACVDSLKTNEQALRRKASAARWATWLVLTDTIFVAIALIALFVLNAVIS